MYHCLTRSISTTQPPGRFIWLVALLLLVVFSQACYASGNQQQIENTESTKPGVASGLVPTINLLEVPTISLLEMQTVSFLDMSSAVPKTWQARTPSSRRRLAQYVVTGDQHAEMVVFYFGSGQGAKPQSHIARWVNQFRPVDGKPVKPKVSTMKTNSGFDVTWVEIQGDYARGGGMGPVGKYKPNQMLIAAITQTPHGNLYIQFHGDKGKILEHRKEFLQFVMALRQKPAS